MKLNKKQLMERAGLTEDPNADNAKLNYNNNVNANQYKKHKGYIAVYRVLGQDFTVGPLKTNDKQEVLDMLGNAIQGGFRLIDIVPTQEFKGVEKYGGLALEENAKVIPSAAGGDVEMTVTFEKAVEYFLQAAEEMGASMIMDPNDKAQQQRFAETMREDLEIWLGNNGAQWLEEGIDSGNYDEFVTK